MPAERAAVGNKKGHPGLVPAPHYHFCFHRVCCWLNKLTLLPRKNCSLLIVFRRGTLRASIFDCGSSQRKSPPLSRALRLYSPPYGDINCFIVLHKFIHNNRIKNDGKLNR